jgi:sugar phosphate isomerase/epimerase
MRYGAMNFPVMPVVEEIHSFGGLGFDYLELTMDPPEAHYSIVSENRLAIARALADHGMGMVCHLPTFVSAADLTESLRRASITEMKRSLSVAADLGVEKVVLHPPMISGMGTFVSERVRAYAVEFIGDMVELSEALGVTICLENMMPRNGFGVEPNELDMLFWRFPTLQFTLDTGHANLGGGGRTRLSELVERFAERLGHVHLSDNRGVYDDHFPLGLGTIDFRRLAKSLKEIGYDGTVTFEVFDEDRNLLVQSRDLWIEMVG